jgi:hypothetical protein
MTVREQVALAAKVLDQDRPGWHDCIKPSTLSMTSLTDCVIGQVYGGGRAWRDQIVRVSKLDPRIGRQSGCYRRGRPIEGNPTYGAFHGRDRVPMWIGEVEARREGKIPTAAPVTQELADLERQHGFRYRVRRVRERLFA